MEDIKALLSRSFQGCEVTVKNSLPSSHGAKIAGVVIDWTYIGGGTSQTVNGSLDVSTGDPAVSFISNDDCVKKLKIYIRIKVDGKDIVLEDTQTWPSGECALFADYTLSVSKSIPEEAFRNPEAFYAARYVLLQA